MKASVTLGIGIFMTTTYMSVDIANMIPIDTIVGGCAAGLVIVRFNSFTEWELVKVETTKYWMKYWLKWYQNTGKILVICKMQSNMMDNWPLCVVARGTSNHYVALLLKGLLLNIWSTLKKCKTSQLKKSFLNWIFWLP